MDIAVGCRLGRMLALALLLTEPAAAATITVTNNLDETTPNNGCSLREAIDNANNNAQTHADCAGGSVDLSLDEIRFNIPGGGVKTIALTADLPTIVNGAGPVSIDGYTQPGASPNTLAVGGNAVLLIELNGGSTHLGLVIDAPGSTVRGLVVNRMSGNGIFVHNTATGTTIAGNYLGTDPTGTIDLGNGGRGVIIDGTSDVTIGGTTPADRNVVSGNQINGVSSGGSGTKIQGNYIGTDRHGTADLGNGTSGVVLSSTGVATVGGTSAGAGNVIAFNDSAGVFVGSLTAGNAILGNAIFSNDGLGIDLVGDGVTGSLLSAAKRLVDER